MAADFPNPPASDVAEWLAGQLDGSTELRQVTGNGRVFPLFVPAASMLPAVTYKRVNTQRQYFTEGQAEGVGAMFEVRAIAESNREGYKALCKVAGVLGPLLSGLQRVANDSQGGRHNIEGVELADEFDDDDPTAVGDGTDSLQRVFMVRISYDETPRGN